MAASEETCDGNPNFAIICSFITKFGDDCGVNIPTPDLQQMLEDTKNVHEDLLEVLLHLMRRGKKRVNKERWEKCIVKFCHEYSSVDAWEIERFGFLKSKLSVKLELLKRLLELQFDANAKFKAEVNKHDATSLRILPLGRDIDGQAYWYQLDKEYNMRLYRETAGEESSWQLMCSTTEHLRTLLASLEKKYSNSSKTEDSDNPKSPSSDTPVPKKEQDSEDLTSCSLSETKPNTIIIKTEKRENLSRSESPSSAKKDNSAIVTDSSNVTENEIKANVKLKLKLETAPHSKEEVKTEKSASESSLLVEKSAIVAKEAEPMEVDITQEASTVSLSEPVSDSKVKDAKSISADKSEPDEHSDQNVSGNSTKLSIDSEATDSVNQHKSSKIKLYEKWNNEKKKLDAIQTCPEQSKTNSEPPVVEKEKKHDLVTSNQKADPAASPTCPKEQSSSAEHSDKQEVLDENVEADAELAVDLSKTSRINVIVQNTSSKSSLSNGVPSSKSSCEQSEDGGFTSKNTEISKQKTTDISKQKTTEISKQKTTEISKQKNSEISKQPEQAVEKSETGEDLSYKSPEQESKKCQGRSKMYSDCYDSSVITSTNSASGFSHLQALQNMCESNSMGGIPSVIQSTGRHNVDVNQSLISENKTVTNSSFNFENINMKSSLDGKQNSSDLVPASDHKAVDVLLKANVQEKDSVKKGGKELIHTELNVENLSKTSLKEHELSSKNSLSSDNKLICNESNLNNNKIDTLNANKCSDTLKAVTMDTIKTTTQSEDNKTADKKEKSDVRKLSSQTEFESDVSQVMNLSRDKIDLETGGQTVSDKEKIDNSIKAQNVSDYRSSVVESSNRDILCKSADSNMLKNKKYSDSLLVENDTAEQETAKNDTIIEPKVTPNTLCATDKAKSKPLSFEKTICDTSNSFSKQSKVEIIDKKESLKSIDSAHREQSENPVNELINSSSLSLKVDKSKISDKDNAEVASSELVLNKDDKVSSECNAKDTSAKSVLEDVDNKVSFKAVTDKVQDLTNEPKSVDNSTLDEQKCVSKSSKSSLSTSVEHKKSPKSDKKDKSDTEKEPSSKDVLKGKIAGSSIVADHDPILKSAEETKKSKSEDKDSNSTEFEKHKVKADKSVDFCKNEKKSSDSEIQKVEKLAVEVDEKSENKNESEVESTSECEIKETIESKIEIEKNSDSKNLKDRKCEGEKESKTEIVKESKCENKKEESEFESNSEPIVERNKKPKSGNKEEYENDRELKIEESKTSEIENKELKGDDAESKTEKSKKSENKEDSRLVDDAKRIIEGSILSESENKESDDDDAKSKIENCKKTKNENKKDAKHGDDVNLKIEESKKSKCEHEESKSKHKEESKSEHKEESKSEHREETKSKHKEETKSKHKEESKSDHKEESKSEHREETKSKHKEETKSKHKEESKSDHKEESKSEHKERSKSKHKEESKSEHKEESKNDYKEAESKHKEESKSEHKEESKGKDKEESKGKHNEESKNDYKEAKSKHKEESKSEHKEESKGKHNEESKKDYKEAKREQKEYESKHKKEYKSDHKESKSKHKESISEQKEESKSEHKGEFKSKHKDSKHEDGAKHKSEKNKQSNFERTGKESKHENKESKLENLDTKMSVVKEAERENSEKAKTRVDGELNFEKNEDFEMEIDEESKTKVDETSEMEVDEESPYKSTEVFKVNNKKAKSDEKVDDKAKEKVNDKSKSAEDNAKIKDTKDNLPQKSNIKDVSDKLVESINESKSSVEKSSEMNADKADKPKMDAKNLTNESKNHEKPLDITEKKSGELVTPDAIVTKEEDNLKNEADIENKVSSEEKTINTAKICVTDSDKMPGVNKSDDPVENVELKDDLKPEQDSKVKTLRKDVSKRITSKKSLKTSQVEDKDTEAESHVDSNLKKEKEKCSDASMKSRNKIESVASDDEKEVNKSSKIETKSKLKLLTEQFKVYNLRLTTCLETKFKHPFCDKYVKNPEKLMLCECPMAIINEDNVQCSPNKKNRSKGKNTQSPLTNKKPQPVEKKPEPPPKKPPASDSKKKPGRTRKKDDNNEFNIPEGFLEILDNAEKAAEKGSVGKKRKVLDLKEAPGSHQSSDNDSTPIKRSRRIQEQHKKKMSELAVEMEREQRIIEQMAKRSNSAKKSKTTPQKSTPVKSNGKGPIAKVTSASKSPKVKSKFLDISTEEDTSMESARRTTRKMNSRSKNLTKMTLLYEDESKDSEFSTSRETEKSKKRRRGRSHKKGFKPWDVSSESSTSIEEITEEEEEEEHEEPLIFDVNEDEFACEEVDPTAEPVVIRRARTAKKVEVVNAEECINDDTPCQKCGKFDKPEWILLCDKCDKGYHTHCLIPPLMIVPDGDWFCQPCEHMALCQCLHEEISKLEVILKQKEREELRKQRLAYVGISLDNVLKPEKKEKSEDESSKEEEEDEEEEEEEEHKKRKPQKPKEEEVDDERHQKLYGKRSVRARRNINYQFKEYDELIFSALQEDMVEVPEEFKEEASEADSDKPFTAKIQKRKKRGRKWKDFDSSDEDSGEEYQGGSTTDSEATAPPSVHSDPESGSGEWKVVKSRKKTQRKPSSRRRKRRGDDSSEEDWDEEEIETEAYRPTTRRAAQKAVSYREISSEEEGEWGASKRQSSKRRRKGSSSDSEASFKKKSSSKKKRVRRWEGSESSEESQEKSMSSSGESEEEEEKNDSEEESENEWKVKKVEQQKKEKVRASKKLLSSDEEDGEESSTRDSAPKKKEKKKYVSDESEEEEEEEEESGSEENSDEEDDDDEDDDDEEEEEEEEEGKEEVKKTEKKNVVPDKKTPSTDEAVAPEKKTSSVENVESNAMAKVVSLDKETSLLIKENKEFQPKVLVKKELCSVDIPLEPMKQVVSFTPTEKAPPKPMRKETTKMVPCVIPYDKSPKSGHASNPEEESDKEVSRIEEMPLPVPPSRPMQYPKQGTTFAPPSSRIQFGGVLPRHSVPPPPPLTSVVRPPMPAGNLHSRFLAPTNLPVRSPIPPGPPPPAGVLVRHHVPPSRLPSRLPGTMPLPPSSLNPKSIPPTQTPRNKSESKPYKSTIMEPFSNMDEENESDEEVPLERIPTASVPAPLPNRPVPFERETEYRPAAKELSTYNYAPPEEKPFPGSYSSLSSFQDFSTRPSPLKPSLVETYPNNSSPSKLTPLDTYSQTSSPKGFISLDSYSENRKKKHFYGSSSSTSHEVEPPQRPVPPPPENFQGGEIRFPPEPYPCPPSPNTFSNRSPPPPPPPAPTQRDPGTPPRLYSQFPDAYAPPRSPEYYQNHQYYASEERIPRPSYQPNYAPQEPSYPANPYVATPVPQPNGGFMIDTLLRARNHEEGEDELTGVTDIVSYITQE